MTVKHLVALLLDQDPEAEVRLAHQPNWPFEYSVSNVCNRRDLAQLDRENRDEEAAGTDEITLDQGFDLLDGQSINDVLIGEGQQLCYGDNNTWDCGVQHPVDLSKTEWAQFRKILYGD